MIYPKFDYWLLDRAFVNWAYLLTFSNLYVGEGRLVIF